MFLKISTYVVAIRRGILSGTVRSTPMIEPSTNAITQAAMDTSIVHISPDIIHKQLTIYGSWTFSSVGQAECAQFIIHEPRMAHDQMP